MKIHENKYRISLFISVFALITLMPGGIVAQTQTDRISPVDEATAKQYFIEGVAALENEDYQDAIDLLNIAYLAIPDSPGVNYTMADAYLALQDFENAEYYAKIAVELDPENKWYHLKLAQVFRINGRNDRALEALEVAESHISDDLNILFQLATLYTEMRQYEDSNRVYDQILNVRGDDMEILRRKYRNYIQMDDQEAAISELKKMNHIDPDNLGTLHTLGQLYIDMDELSEAMDVLLKAKERNPRNPETLILLADIYMKQSQWDRLGDTFVSMIEDRMFSASQKMELARFLYLTHESNPNQPVLTEQTRRVLESFSVNEPEFGEAHLLAAEFLLNQNEMDAAVHKLERANEVMPGDEEAWRQRLQLMFSNGQYEKVIEAGRQAVEHVGDDAFIHFFVGASFMMSDAYEEAAEWLEQATLMPSRRDFRSVVHGTLGDVLTELDRWEEAVESYETALRLDSSNHTAMNNFAYYLSLRQERLDEAEEMALTAISYEPENAAYLDTVGWIYFKKGDYEKAKEYIQSSIATGDASAEVYEHMGDVYEQLEQISEAKRWWQKALEEDPDRTYLHEKIQ